jgi:hypothetical protein
MTLAQLSAELLARDPSQSKGLSNKTKDWYLKQLGEGSIWMSAAPTTRSKAATAKDKKSPDPKASKATAKKVSGKESGKSAIGTAAKKKSNSANRSTVNANILHTSSQKAALDVAASSTRVKQKAFQQKIKKAAPVKPDKASSSSGPFISSVKTARRTVPVQVVSTSAATVKVEADSRSQASQQLLASNTNQLPTVSSKMTVAQLKEEMLAREPHYKGISKMKHADLLAYLVEGSAWESHPEVRQSRAKQAQALHTLHSRAHPHPLALSEELRCLPQCGTKHKRVRNATCDCPF